MKWSGRRIFTESRIEVDDMAKGARVVTGITDCRTTLLCKRFFLCPSCLKRYRPRNKATMSLKSQERSGRSRHTIDLGLSDLRDQLPGEWILQHCYFGIGLSRISRTRLDQAPISGDSTLSVFSGAAFLHSGVCRYRYRRTVIVTVYRVTSTCCMWFLST